MKKIEKNMKVKAIVSEVVEAGTYSELVKTYWETGRYIVEYEQHGADRAKYGEGLIVNLSKDLRLRYGGAIVGRI